MKRSIIDSPDVFRQWCSKLEDTWSLDFETTSLNWLGLEVVGWSICDGKQACYVICNTEYKKELLLILEYHIREAKCIIFHNSSFDMMCLKKEGIEI